MLREMVLAADLVSSMWLRASSYFWLGSKLFVTPTTMTEIRKAPQMAVIMAIHLPGIVDGVISPYPTVVRVAQVHQIELK